MLGRDAAKQGAITSSSTVRDDDWLGESDAWRLIEDSVKVRNRGRSGVMSHRVMNGTRPSECLELRPSCGPLQ